MNYGNLNNHQIMRWSLASVWLLTALASLAYPPAASLELLSPLGLTGMAARSALYAGITLDLVMGTLTLTDLGRWQRWLWMLQACTILTYTALIVLFLPDLALHPFGMLIKNIPILAMLWMLWRSENTHKESAHV
ncbi:MAG TPA: DoxX-like family protein [Gallionellaceae bacterium]|nr:DoxX-like family protein [Gallionellaceae bacterium]